MAAAMRLPILCLLVLLAVAPGEARAQEPTRLSLSMFHFNLQYVAGGLQGFPDGASDLPGTDLDDEEVQDRIVTESFEPALDLLLAHPTWKLTLELQGYMVEVMQHRHPRVLAKLHALVESGQVELVSFHYSDQLFLAYPRVALERSHELLDDALARADLSLSPVTFCQEGQFGEGIATVAPGHGQTILGLPKNLFRFQHPSEYETAAPVYRLGDTDVVLIGRGFDDGNLQVTWSFFDDGELWSTGGLNPYYGDGFRLDPASVAEFEQGLADQEAAGFRIATIQEYVQTVKAAGYPQSPLPPILDGTWQPGSTDSMYRWMGKSGVLDVLYECERDNLVLTGNVRAIHALVTAETLLSWGRANRVVGDGEYRDGLRECWRSALLGQVSDASGINPFINEVRYGLEHAEQARACATAVSTEIARRSGRPFLAVDNQSGEITGVERPTIETAVPEAAFLTEADGFSIDAPLRTVEAAWEAVGASGGLHRVTIASVEPVGVARTMTVTFPMELDELRLSPGLVEDEVRHYPLAAFDFEDGKISLPIANGLFGLREGLWLILDTSQVHVAATIEVGQPTVTFRDATMDAQADTTWVFYLLEGTAEEALAEATRRNVRPTVFVAGAPAARGGGCTCRVGGSAQHGSAAVALGVLLLLVVRRRRR